MTRRILLSLVNLFLLSIGMAGHARVATAANTIESTYAATGSFSVSTANVTDASGTVIYWAALRKMGITDRMDGFGDLLKHH